MVQVSAQPSAGWADLLAEGRLPKFAMICLGIWLNAADSLVTATIMPSVGADLGGYAYFSWATAGFLMGAILAGASTGRLSERFGLRWASAIAGLAFALGCVASAAAPTIGIFLAGRLLQGIGSGWVAGFLSWPLKSGQSVKLFPSMRRTGLDGQGYAQAVHG